MQWRPKKSTTRKARPAPATARRPERNGQHKAEKTEKKERKGKLSRLHKPADMTLEEWQIALRRQFGREQKFRLKNVGDHAIFSEFDVANPQTQSVYRVRIRGAARR